MIKSNFNICGTQGAQGGKGENGVSPHIGSNGNWFVGTSDTGVKAQGLRGFQGIQGEQGIQGIQGVQGEKGEGVEYTSASQNLDDCMDKSKVYTIGDGVTINNPIVGNGFLRVYSTDDFHVRQVAYSQTDSSEIYTRIKNNSSWSSWLRIVVLNETSMYLPQNTYVDSGSNLVIQKLGNKVSMCGKIVLKSRLVNGETVFSVGRDYIPYQPVHIIGYVGNNITCFELGTDGNVKFLIGFNGASTNNIFIDMNYSLI